MNTTHSHTPPMDPDTSEADSTQLELAHAQGDAYGRALEHMAENVAEDGGIKESGDYIVGYAVEEAEGMYAWAEGSLVWRDPETENLHLEVSVRDRSDGRFVPGLDVSATLTAPDGQKISPIELPMLWHPMIYHYGRNVEVPDDGQYTLRVHIDPPQFMRHDEVNGRRFVEPVDVTFDGVQAKRGQD